MKPLPVQFVRILAAFSFPSLVGADTGEIKIQADGHGWAGSIAEAHPLPFTAESRFEFGFFADTAGNDGQALILSDQGRYAWCDEPFRFKFDRGMIRWRADSGTPQLGTHRRNLL